MNYGKKKYGLLIIAILLLVSVGYALINTTLNINGSSKIRQARWNIYFDKVENESGVTSTETKIDSKKTTVSFDIDLEKPGDYYQFNVDTVNDGTIDAIIDSTELTGLSDTTKEIIDYTVTYADGSSVNKCDTLNSGDRKTLLVKVNHFKDVKEDELLSQAENLKLKFKINYVQTGACSREPILEIDPNGGKYNDSRKVTKQNVTKNTSITIPEAEREGYNFVNWKTSSGVDLEKDSETHLTTVNMGTTDQKIIAQWEKAIDPAQVKHTITIDPNGGLYDGSSDVVTYQKKKNETVEVSTSIEREGYTFTGWVLDPVNSSFANNTLTVGLTDVTLTAGWELNEDEVVAKIGNKYYVTLQKAFNAAVTGDKIELLKDITEVSTNNKEVSLDLGGHTITGTINNSGNLRVDNGKIQNLTENQAPIVNTGTITVGTNDDTVSDDSIILYGKTTGLIQNGAFYFYDGYIEGDTAFRGGYNGAPTGYVVNVVWDSILNCQKAMLSLTPEGAVAKIKSFNSDGTQVEPLNYIFYFDLNSAVEEAFNQNLYNPDVYIVAENPESSTDITVAEGKTLNIHLDGNTLREGAHITNYGTFSIQDTAQNKGTFRTSYPIINHNVLNLSNINLETVSNTENVIENYKDINVTNSTVTAINKYALYNKSTGTLNFDNSTYFTSSGGYAFYNDSTEEINLNGGNFTGIHNKGKSLIVDGTTVTNPTNNNAIYNELTSGILTLRNVTVNTTNKYVLENKGTANIESGNYSATNAYVFNNYSTSSTLNITGGTIIGGGGRTINGGIINISGDNTNISNTNNNTSAECVHASGTTNINGGNISSTKGIAVYQYSGTLNISGGNITNSSSSYASVYVYGGTTNITGGSIISENNTGFYTQQTANITDGFIKGKTYGIYITNSSYGKLTIGTDDDNVDPDLPERKPVIMGDTYGLYKSSGTVNFYDGIIKGKNSDVYYGEINEIADGTEIVKDTETIDEEQYYTAYLYNQEDFLQVGSGTYNSLKKAINAISSTGEILVYRNGKVSSPSTIPSTKNITLDLNGLKLTSTIPIINQGTLKIVDNSTDDGTGKKGTIENAASNIIENKKTLVIDEGIFNASNGIIVYQSGSSTATTTINDGTFTDTATGANYAMYIYSGSIDIEGGNYSSASFATISINTGTNTIKNATINNNSSSNGKAVDNDATLTLDNVTINNSYIGIQTSNPLTISNSNITSKYEGIYQSTGGVSGRTPNVTVNNSNITATGSSGRGVYVDSGTLTFNSGSITSNGDGILTKKIIKLYGGTVYGKSRGIYADDYSTTSIGNNDDEDIADITKPIVIGDSYGIYINGTPEVGFYDGIIKSKTTQVYGTITTTPEGYVTENGVDSLDSSYKTTYLTLQQPFIQVGTDPTNVFSSLQPAIDEAGANGSMKLVGNGIVTLDATISNTQNISLDLNGYTMTTTKTITNKGTFTIKDENNQNGTITSISSADIFSNKGTLNINSGNYNVDKGKFISIESGSIFNLNGGAITGTSNNIITNKGTFNMTDGTIDYTGSYNAYPISSDEGNIYMSGGTIGNTTSRVSEVIGMRYNQKTFELSGSASIIAGNGVAVNVCGSNSSSTKKPTFTMNGGSIYSSRGNAMSTSYGAIVAIHDGSIKSDYQDALYIQDSGNVSVDGGEFIGKRYGIYIGSGTLTLGNNNSEIKLTPILKGETYGLYINGGTANLYDGIIKGKNDSVFYGNITATADNTIIGGGTEVDPDTGDTYYTKYLISQEPFVMNKTKSGNPTYTSLQLAIDEADSEDELELYKNGTVYNSITFPDKTLKLDLNNFNISISGPITNNGTVTIIDENTSGTKGKISTIGSFDLITNNKSLSVDNVSLENEFGNYYIINNSNSSTLTLNDADINGKYGIKNNSLSTLTSTNSNINSIYYDTITNNGGTIDITGGTISNSRSDSSATHVLTLSSGSLSTVTIRNATISKANTYYETIYSSGRDDLKLYNVDVNGKIHNIGENTSFLYDGGTINGYIHSFGDMTINNITLNASGTHGISNRASTSKLVKVSNSNITVNNANGENNDGIRNNGNIRIKNTNITLNNASTTAGVRNYGSGQFEIIGGNISVSGSGNGTIFGISNNTTSSVNNKIRPNNVNVSGGTTAYGIYNPNGTLTLISGKINVSNATIAYGVYLSGGTYIQGTYDGSGDSSADVSTITPLVKGIGTNGYGIYRIDGAFRFYDGKLIGSTSAKPSQFAPEAVEYNYIVRTITETTTGYEYIILECINQQSATDIDWSVKVSDDDIVKQRVFSVDNINWVDSNNNPVSQIQYGALGNIKIKVDGNSMSSDFNYRIDVTLADGSPIEVTNNNIVETMTISSDPEDNKKDFTIALNCASPTADYTTIDKDITVTITIEPVS